MQQRQRQRRNERERERPVGSNPLSRAFLRSIAALRPSPYPHHFFHFVFSFFTTPTAGTSLLRPGFTFLPTYGMVLSTVLYKSFICLLSSPPAHLSLTLTYIDLDRRVAVLLLDCCSSRSWIPSIWPVYTRLQRALHRPRPRLLRQPREHTRPPTRGIAHSLVDRVHTNRTEPNHSYTSVLVHLCVRLNHRTRCVDSFLSAVRTLPGPSTCYPLHQVRDTHTLTR